MDDKDYIIKLQRERIESLEKAIGFARDCDYDKIGDEDGELWHHPLMSHLMAVLEEHGHTPMSKDTQICLVKAALEAVK